MSRFPAQVDVLVAGLGPAGSAVAIHLARGGVNVLAVDKARFPRDKPCSEYLSPEGLRHLDELGVLGDLEPLGAPLAGTSVFGPRGSSLTGRFAAAPISPWRATGLSIARRLLDARLVRQAGTAGARIEEGVAMDRLLYDGGRVAGGLLRTEDGAHYPVRARVVVGADGLRSETARQLGRRRRGPPSRLALVAHLGRVRGLEGLAEMHVGAEGYVGLNQIRVQPDGGGTTNVALVIPAVRAAELRGRPTEFFFTELERYPGVAGRIDRTSLEGRLMVTGPFATRSTRVVTDGAILVGDAADFFDPFTGQGISSALIGARLAAGVMAEALSEPGPVDRGRLAAYRRARRRAFAGKWMVERLVGYGMWFPRLFDRAVSRLERRGLAATFIGVTGDFVPPGVVLDPRFLARMVF